MSNLWEGVDIRNAHSISRINKQNEKKFPRHKLLWRNILHCYWPPQFCESSKYFDQIGFIFMHSLLHSLEAYDLNQFVFGTYSAIMIESGIYKY